MSNERWKPVKGLKGLFLVSDLGRVMCASSGNIVRSRESDDGCITVLLPCKDTTGVIVSKPVCVHKLMIEAFGLSNTERINTSRAANHIRKLTDDDVETIRRIYKPWSQGPNGRRGLAYRFGVSEGYIHKIVTGQARSGLSYN